MGVQAYDDRWNLAVEWRRSALPVDYAPAVEEMERRAEAVRLDGAAELVWLLEHPAVYTAGTSASAEDLLDGARFPVVRTGRGGKLTYHGPGQRVVYVIVDLKRYGGDVRKHVWRLEEAVIRTLAELGLTAVRRQSRIGVWVADPREAKIAAIGVRVRRWVAYHGLSLNIAPDLDHFSGIVPCGISEFGVTSLAELGVEHDTGRVDVLLSGHLADVFGLPGCLHSGRARDDS